MCCREEEREAGRIALQRLASRKPTDTETQLSLGLDHYFDHTASSHPGVTSCEILLSALSSSPPQASHFAAVADLPGLLKLLEPSLPLRTQHLACCVLSLLLRPAALAPLPPPGTHLQQAGGTKQAQAQGVTAGVPFGLEGCWGGGNRGADVHTLLPKLEGLVALEGRERASRCVAALCFQSHACMQPVAASALHVLTCNGVGPSDVVPCNDCGLC